MKKLKKKTSAEAARLGRGGARKFVILNPVGFVPAGSEITDCVLRCFAAKGFGLAKTFLVGKKVIEPSVAALAARTFGRTAAKRIAPGVNLVLTVTDMVEFGIDLKECLEICCLSKREREKRLRQLEKETARRRKEEEKRRRKSNLIAIKRSIKRLQSQIDPIFDEPDPTDDPGKERAPFPAPPNLQRLKSELDRLQERRQRLE